MFRHALEGALSSARSLISAAFFCETCQKQTRFLPIHFALAVAGVSRSTMYYWMERGWIHWRELPSGRRVICQDSLSRQARKSVDDLPLDKNNRPKPSDSVQPGKLTRH